MFRRLPIRLLTLGSFLMGVASPRQPAQAPPTRFAVEIVGDHGTPNGFVTLSTGISTSRFFASNLHRQLTLGMEDEKRMLDMNLKQFLPGAGIQLQHNDLTKFWAAVCKSS
jgi:hypothetical protein